MATTLATKRPEVLSSLQYCPRCAFARLSRSAPSQFLLVKAVLAAVTSLSLGAPSAVAQTSRFTPSISVDESFTNNVNLDSRDAAKNENRISSFIVGVVNSAAFKMGTADTTTLTTDDDGPVNRPTSRSR